MKKVTLLHTVKSVYSTFSDDLKKACPEEIEVDSLVDEYLVTNAKKCGYFPENNMKKLRLDLQSATLEYPDLIIVTCSSLTPFVKQMLNEFSTPILSIDDEMCRQAAMSNGKILVVATAPTTVGPTVDKIKSERESAVIETLLIEEAMDRLKSGDVSGHDALIAARVREFTDVDVIVLAQASMASAKHLVYETTGKKVLTSPESCINKAVKMLFGENK